MSSHGFIVAWLNEETGFGVDDLERDAACVCGDDGDAFVQCFLDFDFESLAGGELECYFCV